MKAMLTPLLLATIHLDAIDRVFSSKESYAPSEAEDFELYSKNLKEFEEIQRTLELDEAIYSSKDRQMKLADVIEYLFFGRGYYTIGDTEQKGQFIEALMRFVNMLMSIEILTVSHNLRKRFLDVLMEEIPSTAMEKGFKDLGEFDGHVGLPLSKDATEEQKNLNKYFDSLLPKTAGGLWHEILSFIFLLRNDVGYVIPLLLSQRLFSGHDHLVPPDFLIIGKDKRIYGIEVGRKKEIQSGGFSLKTAIPTASFDTENSRSSDRCPICHKWIQFCDFVIEHYSNLKLDIPRKVEFRCLTDRCSKYTPDEIAKGVCPFTKYSRPMAKTIKSSQHEYANGHHYHYKCVLNSVSPEIRKELIENPDEIALKTHFPYYQGLEELIDDR